MQIIIHPLSCFIYLPKCYLYDVRLISIIIIQTDAQIVDHCYVSNFYKTASFPNSFKQTLMLLCANTMRLSKRKGIFHKCLQWYIYVEHFYYTFVASNIFYVLSLGAVDYSFYLGSGKSTGML